MKKYSLQLRLTVAVGLILVTVCALLTINSIFSANTYYGDYAKLLEQGLAEYDPALTDYAEYGDNQVINYEEANQKFSFQSIIVMAVIIIAALAVTYWATGHMLKPLRTLTDSVRSVDEQNLGERMPLDKTGGEVLVLAEAYNRMLDRLQEAFMIQKSFASNAAHELKTPLAVIKSSLQVLEIHPSPQLEDYQEFMSDTSQSLERIIKTVDGLLSLANPAAAPVDQRVELCSMVAQAAHELSGRARTAKVTVTFSCEALPADASSAGVSPAVAPLAGASPADTSSAGVSPADTSSAGVSPAIAPLAGVSPEATGAISSAGALCDPSVIVMGNYSLLYRAIYNLMENAIKYNRPGGTVAVTIKPQADRVAVTVKDSGIGMESAVLEHIFEPFYRADPSRSQKIPGSGLGLAVVKMILERHNGTIAVESEPGEGTVFTVSLKAMETFES